MPLNDDEKADLVAYLDGELDEAATQVVEAKLAVDPDARAELDALKQTWGMLDYLPKASPSANFTHRTLERLTLEKVSPAAPRRETPWLAATGWAAALLVAVGVGYLAATTLWPAPTPDPILEADRPLVRHLRIVEKWRYYENTDDLDFVQQLVQPDLFGEDPG